MEWPDGRRFAFVVSHPSSKKRSMDGARGICVYVRSKSGLGYDVGNDR